VSAAKKKWEEERKGEEEVGGGGGNERAGKLLKIYTKFFGGKLLFEHLHPLYIYNIFVARILNWRPINQNILGVYDPHFNIFRYASRGVQMFK